MASQTRDDMQDSPAMQFLIYRKTDDTWHWVLVGPNSRRIASNAMGFPTRCSCMADIRELMAKTCRAPVLNIDDMP